MALEWLFPTDPNLRVLQTMIIVVIMITILIILLSEYSLYTRHYARGGMDTKTLLSPLFLK